MLLEHPIARKMDKLNLLDLNLDSTPIIDWLANVRQAGILDRPALRRSLIARMIWQVSYQRSPGLIDNVAYLLGYKVWGENPRATLAEDIIILRRALAAEGKLVAFSSRPGQRGFYFRERPTLDGHLEKLMLGAIAEVDPVQMAITRRLSTAERFAQGFSMIAAAERAGAYRLRVRQPHLSEEEALYLTRQGKVR
jgi:hypothetical protein